MTETIPDFIETEVTVSQPLTESTAKVRLANGREIFGYWSGRAGPPPALTAGGHFKARLFVADFSRAELTASADQVERSMQ